MIVAPNLKKEFAQGSKISIIDLVDCLFEDAYNFKASDIHIDPEDERIQIRFRIDGVLHDIHSFNPSIYQETLSRIKILARLRTDEHQAAQDGRFRYFIKGTNKPVDVRVSIVPTFYGENIVMRLLVDQAEELSLESLGLSEENRKKILRAARRPHGMILATGPTGSGKTTTLYTLIKLLNSRNISIITIEDPIEYAVKGVNQIQTNPRAGLTFANGLRSILRQDPNIIMVGEIRDAETAGIAVNTALTGHLLLSTLHTNDAATTLPRLLDMKIEAYLIASTVNIAVGQRLVRKICQYCKREKVLTAAEKKSLSDILPGGFFETQKTFYYGEGCDDCAMSGYKGRTGVYEVLAIDNHIRDAVLRRASADEINKIAVEQGMTSMFDDAAQKVKEGVTTLEEMLRMLHE